MFYTCVGACGGHTPPQQCPLESAGGGVGDCDRNRGPGMMGRGWDVCGGRGVGALRHHNAVGKAANQPIQTQSKSSRFGGVRMSASRAAFSRSILAIATTLAAGLAAPAMADQFSFGLHLYAAPEGMTQDLSIGVPLAKDGSAVGATYYFTSGGSARYGARITPSGTAVFPDPSRAYDISDGGAYTVELRTRRSSTGVIAQVLPASTPFIAPDFTPQISGDGSVVAGSTEITSSGTVVGSRAYRWTEQGGMQTLSVYRAGALFTSVEGMSQDGSTVVGRGRTQFFGYEQAWKWTEAGSFTVLPTVPGAFSTDSAAYASNFDGTIIVGRGAGPISGTGRALVWRGEQVTELLPLPGYRVADAYDLSDDGSVISGLNTSSDVGLPRMQTIWTEPTGWVPALDYFRLHGVEIPDFWFLSGVPINVSADGTTFSLELFDTRTSQYYVSVVVVPSPGVVPLLGVAFIVSRRARARRVL